MKTDGRRESDNVEDRRGETAGGGGGGLRFPAGGLPGGRGGLGIVGLIIVVVVSLVFGIDPRQFLDPNALSSGGGDTAQTPGSPIKRRRRKARGEPSFVSFSPTPKTLGAPRSKPRAGHINSRNSYCFATPSIQAAASRKAPAGRSIARPIRRCISTFRSSMR